MEPVPSAHPAPSRSAVDAGLERKIALSRWALAFERAWPLLWLPLSVLGLAVLMSLAGVWPLLATSPHIGLLAALALALAGSLVPLVRLPAPTRQQALERLEALSGMPHRPASSYEDRLADGPQSEPTATLWLAHRQRLARLIGNLRPRAPRPRTEPRDPLAFRALLLIALAAMGLAAGDAFPDRLSAAFRFGPAVATVPTRLDAWVTPPAYTGRQPVLLTDGQQIAGAEEQQSSRRFDVPEGSELTVRAVGPAHANYSVRAISPEGALFSTIAEQPKPDPSSLLSEFRTKLDRSGAIHVNDGGQTRFSWQFQVIPDLPPTIALTQDPKQGARGSLILDYRATDDYGVASAEARFALAEVTQAKALKLADGTEIAPLGEAPKMPLKLPKSASMKDVKGRTSLDLASHLWAGLKVRMTLVATDHAGHTGTVEPQPFVLPERQFRNPLARALIEQRRKLAFSPGNYLDVRYALDAMAIAPEEFPIDPAAYLSLRSAYRQLTETPSTELFKSVTEQLWQLALRVESGRLSEDELALKDAEDKLAKALEEGASDAEIKRLMQDLRQALNNFLRSLAEQGPRPGDPNSPPQDAQQLSPQDFEQMLKNMEQMAQSGNKGAAQQMLSQLRDLLDRLQSGKMADQGQSGQMRQMLDKFGNLIGKQKKLLDDTFKSGRERRNGEGKGQGQNDKQGQGDGATRGTDPGGLGGLEKRQGDLRGELDKLLEDLNGAGAKSPDQLQDAGRSMDDARDSLQAEDPDTAAQNQGRALDQLRKGAQSMAEQMMKAQGQQQGDRAGNNNRDPLGRRTGQDSLNDNGLDNGSNLQIDGKDVQRSRQIIEELRRRLGETQRPPGELDYLERLLK